MISFVNINLKCRLTQTMLVIEILLSSVSFAQQEVLQPSRPDYQSAFDSLVKIVNSENPSFKKAVFVTENAYFGNSLAYTEFENKIQYISFWIKQEAKTITLKSYRQNDSDDVKRNMAIFKVMSDTCRIYLKNEVKYHLPFCYDFANYSAEDKTINAFVTKLLVSRKGNCQSLPYLYKILADELNLENAWLSFAPHHIYIKNYCKGFGWYNTELTSKQFPIDAWIIASGYVTEDAVRSGIYMDTLSNRQAVANCFIDLARSYEKKFRSGLDTFMLKCCDIALQFHSNNINAIIYKAELLKNIYLSQHGNHQAFANGQILEEMQTLYAKALDLGYKEVPRKVYQDWLFTMKEGKNKYSDTQSFR
jgi:hypothetical protein